MNKRQVRPGAAIVLLCLLFSFFGCRPDLPEVPKNESFTRERLETLGDLLRQEMLSTYQFLPEIAPFDTSVYWYVQTLYSQATYAFHLDRQSPTDNRWRQDREWKVFIIDDDNWVHVFALPGGDLFVTTGLLKSLHEEYELFALLSFEASLMHEGHLLNQLIETYNSLVISKIIDSSEGAGPVSAALPALVFAEKTVEDADEQSLDNVCATSILDPTGIAPLMEVPGFESSQWAATRPWYPGRKSKILAMPTHQCGKLKTNGGYQRFVLDRLP